MKQIGGLTAKQAEILVVLGCFTRNELSVRQIAESIGRDGVQEGWVGIDPEGMRLTLERLLLRGFVARREYIRLRTHHARWRWWITQAGDEALARHFDAIDGEERDA